MPQGRGAGDVVAELVQQRARPDPRTYVGKGKLAELKEAFPESGAESLIVDDELSPVQQRQLEDWADESLYFYEMAMRLTWPANSRRWGSAAWWSRRR